jgi:hypothetical protein
MTQDTNNPQPENQGQFDYNRFTQQNTGGNLQTPNSVPVLILGILSIVFCWCYGVLSAVMGIVALVLANAGEKEYNLNPHLYSVSSYKNLKAGKTCAIIGLCLAGLSILLVIAYIVIFGTIAFNMFNLGRENW